jgi:polysaccharide deacetylase 2 family uncharacterized protein YibQ
LSSADGKPRRRGPIGLVLAWLAVLTAGAGLAAYAVVTGPPTRPVETRPQLSMSLPEPARPEPANTAGGPGAGPGPPTPAAQAEPAGEQGGQGEPEPSTPDPQRAPANQSAAATGDAEQPAGVAGNIPQPPGSGEGSPTDLLSGDAPDDADRNGGQETASRSVPAEPAPPDRPASDDGAAAPQRPVGDPDAPAWKRYAQRMAPPQGMPKIAVIVRGLGLSSAAAETAVNRLPASVSLAFTPYARDRAQAWAAAARRNGHEVLVDLPMEPADYPATDPGPRAIMSGLDTRENLARLDWLLAQVDREVGAVAQMGAAVLTDPQAAEPVLRALKERGLMFVDNGAVADSAAREVARRLDLPFAVNDRTLDGGQVSRRAIESRLVEAERLAREQGLAVVMAHPYPVSLDLLVDWTAELETRGFVLVPATYAAIQRAGRNAAQLR